MPVQKPRARTDDLVIEEVDDELLVYDSTNKRGPLPQRDRGTRVARLRWLQRRERALRSARAGRGGGHARRWTSWKRSSCSTPKRLKVVQARLRERGRAHPPTAGQEVGDGRRRDRRGPAGLLDQRQLRPWPWRRRRTCACALFSTNACGTSAGAGAVAGCCCCCQGGGDCKIGGAITTCAMGSCPQDKAPMCSASCNQQLRGDRGRSWMLRRWRFHWLRVRVRGRDSQPTRLPLQRHERRVQRQPPDRLRHALHQRRRGLRRRLLQQDRLYAVWRRRAADIS